MKSVISYNYVKIKVDSYGSLSQEKAIKLFHNVVILITLVYNKDKNNYYYSIFLEKTSHELPTRK